MRKNYKRIFSVWPAKGQLAVLALLGCLLCVHTQADGKEKHDSATIEFLKDKLSVKISGKVLDEKGEPLPGATVLEKGTSNGTQSDVEGNFSLEVSNTQAVLVVSYLGFRDKEVEVGNQSILNITLSEDLANLDEVVVIGYGTARRKDITGAVASIKPDEALKTPSNNFIHSLQGRAAGVNIKSSDNAPGGGIRVRIRGTSSIGSGSQPLYVVDGFPLPVGLNDANPLNSLSDSDIESIDILKDASATAIYGAQGANGVVIITTKKGRQGKAKVELNYSAAVQTVRKKLDLANAEELAILTNEWAANNNQAPIYDGVNRPLPSELGEGTDWQDQIFRTALTHRYNVSISGGDKKATYMVAADYLDQDGIIIESNFKRAGLKFNFEQRLGKRLRVGVNMNANRSVNHAVPTNGTGFQDDSPLWNAQTTTPVIPVRDENGNFLHNHDESVKVLENPVAIATTRKNLTGTTRVLTSTFLEYELIQNLKLRANFGADIFHSKNDMYIPTTAQTQALPNKGVASITGIDNTSLLAEYLLSYNKQFGDDHRLGLTLGHTVQTSKNEYLWAGSNDFINDVLEYNNLGAGSDPRPAASNVAEFGLLSYLGRLSYAYKDKYSLTGTLRRDGSSRFGKNNKWGWFPSLGAAWTLSEEKFIKDLGVFSYLKLRGSIGLAGNANIGNYRSIRLFGPLTTYVTGAPVVGFVQSFKDNPDLKWETTKQVNGAVEFGFFENALNFTAEYYVKTTRDLLLDRPIPNQTGFGSITDNIGSVENRGFEFTLGLNKSFGNFRWNSNFNISFNKSKVLELQDGTKRLLVGIGQGESAWGESITRIGDEIGLFYGYRFEGIWDSEEEILAAGSTVGGVNRPGLPQYADLNGDGFRRDDADREVIGNPNPDFIYGFSNDFSYKNFTLSVFINGSYGNDIADMNGIGLLAQPQKHNVYKRVFDERWTGPGTSTTIEAPLTNAGEWKNFSSRDVQDGSYLRFKTINLSYDIPLEKINRSNWIGSARVFLAGDNLITLTKYTGYDPEVDLYSTSNIQSGVDNGGYPMSKGVRFGVKLGF
ncbi:TonB-dependent receptor [Marinilongibacter aquaticus]|uniref:SusC/RagA family TonB-linked outer membrane protein n=1 Tax=Marinilongibacter aquaticus TaxID=2975157 RepID=UPI0021BDA48D|nr:TonB-dependent receptor [Marinilongibacter aquaticus]UBM60748.1 TonB-dependent receptor [Marinilongibacter aquaticus]